MGPIPGTRHHPQGAIVSELPFILVIISAMAHGYWNFLFKQAEDKDAFLGLSKLVEILYIICSASHLFTSRYHRDEDPMAYHPNRAGH